MSAVRTIQHAKRIRSPHYIAIFSLTPPHFSTLSHKGHDFRETFFHPICCPSDDRSIAFSKSSSPQSAFQCLLFQFTAFSPFSKVTQQLLTSSSSSQHFYPSLLSFRLQRVLEGSSYQDVTNPASLPSFHCL